jgi:hypothetical protein
LHTHAAIVAEVEGPSALYTGSVDYGDGPDDTEAFTLDYGAVKERGWDAVVREHVDVYHRAFFFRKTTDWAMEHEFRWVLYDSVPAPVFVKIGQESLKGIIVSESFPRSSDRTLLYLAEQLGVPVQQCVWINGVPLLTSFRADLDGKRPGP